MLWMFMFVQARALSHENGEAPPGGASPLLCDRSAAVGSRRPSALTRVARRPTRTVRAAVLAHHALEAGLAHALRGLRRRAADDPAAPHADDLRPAVSSLRLRFVGVRIHKSLTLRWRRAFAPRRRGTPMSEARSDFE